MIKFQPREEEKPLIKKIEQLVNIEDFILDSVNIIPLLINYQKKICFSRKQHLLLPKTIGLPQTLLLYNFIKDRPLMLHLLSKKIN